MTWGIIVGDGEGNVERQDQSWDFTFPGSVEQLQKTGLDGVMVLQNKVDPYHFRVIFPEITDEATAEVWIQAHGGDILKIDPIESLLGPR
jgi:hypothetical protein